MGKSNSVVVVGLIRKVECDNHVVTDADRELARSLGERSRRYVERRHSVEAIGRIFAEVNRTIGLEPSEEEERMS